MGSEHNLPNFARQTRCGAGTDHMTPVTHMNIIHIELMLFKKIKCVKKKLSDINSTTILVPSTKKKFKILLSQKVYIFLTTIGGPS